MNKLQNFIFLILVLFVPFNNLASNIVGAEITWECQGNGEYVFELMLYGDCNATAIDTETKNIRIWGNPLISTIPLNFIKRENISPICTEAAGNTPIDCNGSDFGGFGGVEMVVFQSNPITLAGKPPEEGWFFTYLHEGRNELLTNIADPTNQDFTISAGMYPLPDDTEDMCIDHSPQFLQSPHVVACAGNEFRYNAHPVDRDMDSLVVYLTSPYSNFEGNFNPSTVNTVNYTDGYSFQNPTPDQNMDQNNVPTVVDALTGAMTFTSFTLGSFTTKIKVDSYRDGIKIAYVEREIQVTIVDCNDANNPPVVAAPFQGGTSYETTIKAGESISFSISSTDNESLQDGTPQSNIATVSGLMFGSDITDENSDCGVTPCATLGEEIPIIGTQGTMVNFEWQTSCDHLFNSDGNALDVVPYTFVFKFQDDYCSVPQVHYETVIIYVENENVIPQTEITCINTDEDNNVTITWQEVTDINDAFVAYQIYSVEDGELNTVTEIETTSFTLDNEGGSLNEYYIGVVSGCNGNTVRLSDTLKNLHLELNNPENGLAHLTWNKLSDEPLDHFGDTYYIYKEFPLGNWELIDSVSYGTNNYRDTITVCSAFINYRVELASDFCEIKSNIEGDDFKDRIVPDIPVISNVSIDTLTDVVTVTWNENGQEDTYGYVIYTLDANGFLVELDTVYGIENITFEHFPEGDGPFQYSVAAFDSCFTDVVPPTFQTSAKAFVHVTNLVSGDVDVCNRKALLSWTGYIGFGDNTLYEIWGRLNNGSWTKYESTTELEWQSDIAFGEEFEYCIRTVNTETGATSLSNRIIVSFAEGGGPSFSYLGVASVIEKEVEIIHRLALDGGVKTIELERYNSSNESYEKIDEQEIGNETEIYFYDEDVEVNRRSYRYRTRIIDTCDQLIEVSNIAQTIFLKVQSNNTQMTHTLQWSPYSEFYGKVIAYNVYRGINGNFSDFPIANINPNRFSMTDSVYNLMDDHTGKICYKVVAIEGDNKFGVKLRSESNIVCPVIPPLVFIPNAFTVGGVNPIFKPETKMHEFDHYSFAIFDRFGRTIFETNQPHEGWDGSINLSGQIAGEGVYIYRLSLRDGNGIEVLRHGHVTLLREQ